MHGRQSLNKLIKSKNSKPNRSPYTVNNSIVMVGDWRLEEVEGNLQATNTETGKVVVIATK